MGAALFQKSKSPSDFNLNILFSADKEDERSFFNMARSFKNHIAERNGIKCALDNIKVKYSHRGLFVLSLDLTIDMDVDIRGPRKLSRPLVTVNTRDDGDHVEDITTTSFESIIGDGLFSINDLRMLELDAINAIEKSDSKENEANLMAKIIAMLSSH